MHPDDIARVRASWTLAVARSDALVIVFYARLFRTEPALRLLFRDVDLGGQADKLHATLDLVVRGLDDLPRLVPALERLGRMHAALGVREEDFAAVGDALLWTLAELLGDDFDAATRRAWSAAYAALALVMRRAMRGATGVPAAMPASAWTPPEPGRRAPA
jgi:nitric oxide dioxygenase